MITQLQSTETYKTPVFGKFCPYYWISSDGQVYLGDTFNEIIDLVPHDERLIDPVGCLELLNFGYLLGSRTLVQGVGKLLWRAEIRGDGTQTRYAPVPHGMRMEKPAHIAAELRQCLEEELLAYVDGAKRVWILLSGGLDSRIVAGILAHFQKVGLLNVEVHTATWGRDLSRDVIYAQRIADHFEWPLHRISYNAELLWSNIERMVTWGGAEISGIHLHGMHNLKDLLHRDDVVIAASWGNSIGRGLFLGHHLSDLKINPIEDTLDLIAPAIQHTSLQQAEKDRAIAWEGCLDYPAAIVELDQQENYMRRMIAQAMDYLRQYARLEQVFTAPKTVATMWAYAPEARVAEVYFHLLAGLDAFLYNLPDANTGIAPSGLSEPDPILRKSFHQFGKWCRRDLSENILDTLHSPALARSGIFNMYVVKNLTNWWLREEMDEWGATERVTNLVGIALLIERFGLQPMRKPTHFSDYLYSRSKQFRKRLDSLGSRVAQWLP